MPVDDVYRPGGVPSPIFDFEEQRRAAQRAGLRVEPEKNRQVGGAGAWNWFVDGVLKGNHEPFPWPDWFSGGGGGSPVPSTAAEPKPGAAMPDPTKVATIPVPGAQPVPVDPMEQMFSDVARYRDLVAGLYPQPPSSDTDQQLIADDFANQELARTKLQAQLALAAGITSAGGGPWKDVGKGFIAAGAVYDDGFQRYQQALNSAAERAMGDQEAAYKSDVAITDAGLKLSAAERAAGREAVEARRQELIEFLKETKPDTGEFGLTEENAGPFYDWLIRYDKYLRSGIVPVPVADPEGQ